MTDDELKVYGVCQDCKKQILTCLSCDGRRRLLQHRGRGQRKPCPGGGTAATGLTPPHHCGFGCGAMIAGDLHHCPACEAWRSETQAKIDGGN